MSDAHSILLLVVLAVMSLGLAAPVGQSDEDAETRVKGVQAAYIRILSGYVDWPARAFTDDKAPVIIGVLGADPFGQILDQSIRDEKAKGRPFEVRRIKALPDPDAPSARRDAAAAELRRCHVLFVSRSERKRVVRIRNILQGAHVLTVSDIPHFAREGGMIELFLESETVRFHINRGAAERAELRLDSKLLRLARKVYHEDR